MEKLHPTKLRLEKAREKIDNIKTTENVKMFQNTFFTREKIEGKLEHYKKEVEKKKG